MRLLPFALKIQGSRDKSPQVSRGHQLNAPAVDPTRALSRQSGTPSAEDCYLPLKELARYCGLCVRTIRGYLTSPSDPLPHYKIGGKILVRRSDFDAWTARFRVVSSDGLDAVVANIMNGF